MAKLWENTYRAVNIALANELADACHSLGLAPVPVIEAAATKPYGFMPFYPGPGVGGHCIPCDPHYLLWQLGKVRQPAPLVATALAANSGRPARITERALDLLAEHAVPARGARVLLIGVAYKEGVADVRESPALEILAGELPFTLVRLTENLGKKGALVRACALADGDVLLFTDSDCVVAPDAVRTCVDALVRHPELGAVSGHCRALNTDAGLLARVQDIWYEGQFRVSKAAEASFGSVSCVSGPLAAFRREAIYNYLPAWAEDRFLGAPFRFATDRQLTGYVLGQAWRGRALKERHADSPFVRDHDYPELRWRVGYTRSARVWTRVPSRPAAFLRQQIRWKKSFIRNLFFTGAFMWRRGPGAAALYYGHALWVIAAPVLVVRHLVWAPLHLAGLLTLLYLGGVVLKGCVWGVAYRFDHPGDPAWRFRPLMSLLSCCVLAWLLPYALLTLRRNVWSRSAA
ncbi:glycosyltransferase [Streptomyces parvulus]|uniref:glycosyltransferase n=1 Tax=Streptomyces parvulus TaxID=146923 RepID=UPI0038274C8B